MGDDAAWRPLRWHGACLLGTCAVWKPHGTPPPHPAKHPLPNKRQFHIHTYTSYRGGPRNGNPPNPPDLPMLISKGTDCHFGKVVYSNILHYFALFSWVWIAITHKMQACKPASLQACKPCSCKADNYWGLIWIHGLCPFFSVPNWRRLTEKLRWMFASLFWFPVKATDTDPNVYLHLAYCCTMHHFLADFPPLIVVWTWAIIIYWMGWPWNEAAKTASTDLQFSLHSKPLFMCVYLVISQD